MDANSAQAITEQIAQQVVADPNTQNLLNGFLGGILKQAPTNPSPGVRDIFTNAALKAYDEIIGKINIEQVPDFLEDVLKKAGRELVKQAIDAFFDNPKHVTVAGNPAT